MVSDCQVASWTGTGAALMAAICLSMLSAGVKQKSLPLVAEVDAVGVGFHDDAIGAQGVKGVSEFRHAAITAAGRAALRQPSPVTPSRSGAWSLTDSPRSRSTSSRIFPAGSSTVSTDPDLGAGAD